MSLKQDTFSRAFFKRGDLWAILALLLIAAAVYGFSLWRGRMPEGTELSAEITLDGQVAETILLTGHPDEIFTLDEQPNVTFEINQGRIRFINAVCPDKLCEQSGFLDAPNETAACLPYRVAVRIVASQAASDVPDVITG